MIECGFEFEFGHDVDIKLFKQIIKFYYPKNKVFIITDNSQIDKILSKNYFILKHDFSVAVKSCKDECTELCTPVFKGKTEILKNFKSIFNILKLLRIKTNRTCSIHINVGFSEKKQCKKINLGKLYLFVNENYFLRLFNRLSNNYCKKIISNEKCKELLEGSDEDVIKNFESHILSLEKSHHASISLDKCKSNYISIIEFRFIGGDYINDFNDVLYTLNTIINSMYYSIGQLKNTKNKNIIENFKKFYKNKGTKNDDE